MNHERVPWDQYFMNMAKEASTRATCLRKKVGAVIVRDRSILATGYNGSPKGQPHCTDVGVGCEMDHGHCVRTVHAEANAITQAAKHGTNIANSTLYSTASPCYVCAKQVVNAGVTRIVFGEFYRPDDRCEKLFREANIEVLFLEQPKVEEKKEEPKP